MPSINLGYGKSSKKFEFDEARFRVLGEMHSQTPLSDIEIGEKFDAPIGSQPLEDIVKAGESVLFVVPDATRQTACGQIINLLVRRLIANGTMPFDIRIIFATGIHRKVTEEEKREIVTPFIAQRVKMLDHNPRDLAQIVRFGETSDGIPIELNRAITEHDHTIIIGGINFHYFAGFSGGRKLICPGLASTRTVTATHKLAFDCERKTRRDGVGTAKLDGNAVHEAFMDIVEKFPPSFSVNTIVNDNGEAVEVFAGDWKLAHRAGCELYEQKNTIKIEDKRGLVIVSCGGYPHDINVIQAHKALDTASRVCKDGGRIVLVAKCENGLGRDDFLSWFEESSSEALAEKLCEKYKVNGQTAWSLLKIAEKFDVRIMSDLDDVEAGKLRIKKVSDIGEASSGIDENTKGYILPFGAKFMIKE